MFRRVDKTLFVGPSTVPIIDGEHNIYFDTSNGSAYLDNGSDNSVLIASYKYDEQSGDFSITKYTTDMGAPDNKYWFIGRSMWNNQRIHNGALYGSGGLDTPVSGYLEGLPIDFNYSSFVASTTAYATYVWVGGRACFSSLFFGDFGGGAHPYYTAWPWLPCADFTPLMAFELSVSIMIPVLALDVLFTDLTNYVLNIFSFVFFQYHHRRYTDFHINTANMYFIKIGRDEIPISPLGAIDTCDAPVLNQDLTFFNLAQ